MIFFVSPVCRSYFALQNVGKIFQGYPLILNILFSWKPGLTVHSNFLQQGNNLNEMRNLVFKKKHNITYLWSADTASSKLKLTLKVPSKIVTDDILTFYLFIYFFSRK